METKEYRYIDRGQWERGPWDDEPDKVQWQDEATGLPCLAVRHERFGNWCGYVGVAEGHPYFGCDCDSEQIDVECHGGLTFSDFCAENNKEHGVCHVPAPGEPDRVWWLGFDCAHSWDYSPGLAATIKESGGNSWPDDVYRELGYVKTQCASLAKQLEAKVVIWEKGRDRRRRPVRKGCRSTR